MTAEQTDEELARQAGWGDQDAFQGLVRRYTRGLFAFCRRIVRNDADAEDRVQEVWVRIHRSLPDFDPSRRFSSWAYKVAQNICIDAVRRREDFPAWAEGKAPSETSIADEPPEEVSRWIDELPGKARAILHYKYVVGLNAAEIADQLDLSHADVRVTLHRAIRFLRARVKR